MVKGLVEKIFGIVFIVVGLLGFLLQDTADAARSTGAFIAEGTYGSLAFVFALAITIIGAILVYKGLKNI